MKYLLVSGAVVLLFVLYVFLYPQFSESPQFIYDDEQEGINDQIVIRFSHVVAENTPKGLAAQRFAELVAKKTNGKVKVEVVPNGGLATDEEEMDALQENKVQMIAPSISKMTKLAPEWGLFDLPFMFNNYQAVKAVLDGQVGTQLLKRHEQEGIKGLAFWANGFKQMTSRNRQLRNTQDFIGQRFRIMPSKIIEEQFNLLGATPIVVPFDQIYTSLATNSFDGQENTISNIYSRRLYTLQSDMTISNHGFLGYVVLMNRGFWNKLPKDVQTDLTEAMVETTKWQWQKAEQMNKQQLKAIRNESSLTIYVLSEQERQMWLKQLHPVYENFNNAVGKQFKIKIK